MGSGSRSPSPRAVGAPRLAPNSRPSSISGQYAQAVKESGPLLNDLRTIGYRPLLADTLLISGTRASIRAPHNICKIFDDSATSFG
jgi:hypothetical protein